MKVHELKCHPGPFNAIRERKKLHEVRVNDRDYQPYDRVVLREWEPVEDTQSPGVYGYTGHVITATVGYLTPGGEWGLPPNVCVFSLLNVEVAS